MDPPPHYILFSSNSASSTALGHPTIQYHYADDSPVSLLPQHPDEHVLLLTYDPNSSSSPSAVSTSRNVVVTGVKVEEAPGAAAQEEKHNDRMYIIETISNPADPKHSTQNTMEHQSPHSALAQFKQRNALLRRALAYPDITHNAASPT
ncbi:hypothetical protein K435DRAFT_724172 [Dendrothele bispora CBS 962.96]|uniref:Uncharacterized protein n=1 Tax=Dendrothele bispora (strain CBS 962.96) TaxID=1314807 RepID=A0A4S8LYN0_DENBC|nr:hypothetical protein K435DRAFT_724172 [Dendrothele bispora CBS 962.96]